MLYRVKVFRDVHYEREIELEADSAHLAQLHAGHQANLEGLWHYKCADSFCAPAEEVQDEIPSDGR